MNMPRVFATAYDSFIATAHKIGHAGGFSIAVDVIQLIVLLLVPLGLVLTFYQLARKAAVGAWNVTDGRPAGRALLVAATAAVAAFAAYAWIPRSVYKPISPTDRGTLGGAIKHIKRIPSGKPPAAPTQPQNGSQTKTPKPGVTKQPTSTTTTPSSTTTTGASTQTTSTSTTTTTQSSTTPAASTQTTATSTTDTTTTQTTPTTTDTTTTTAP
jgi:outer membrane biosynthesis protein TonB